MLAFIKAQFPIARLSADPRISQLRISRNVTGRFARA